MKRVISSTYRNPYDGKLRVGSISSPFGELASNYKQFPDGNERQAIIYWLKESQKYPTCTSIDGLRYQGNNIRKWVIDNEDEFRMLCDKYNCPYETDYMVNACRRPCIQSDEHPDQIHPFSLG